MKPCDQWQLDTKHIGRRVLVFDRVESTNTLAAAMASEPANDGIVILAAEQTAGRGQPGRRWFCPSGAGVLMSVLFFPPPEMRRAAVLTAWAAVSVCETIRGVIGLEAQIKWPNDVLVVGRKVCGILIEKGTAHAVVGIGLNVGQSAEYFRAAELPQAASLAMLCDRPLDRCDIARRLIHQLDKEYTHLNTLEARWKSRFGLLDKGAIVECHAGTVAGVLRDVTFDAVVVELPDRVRIDIPSETIRHLAAG